MRLSSLTYDAVQAAIEGQVETGPRGKAALGALLGNAGCIPDHSDDEKHLRVVAWMEGGDTGGDFSAIDDLAVHMDSVGIAERLGIDARRLAMCADAIDGPAIADLDGHEGTLCQVAAEPTENGHRFTVPLSPDVYYDGARLLLRGPFPHTVLCAAVGRRASDIVSHPGIATAGTVMSIGEPVSGFETLMLEEPRLSSWREIGTEPSAKG